jgi:type I restriction enzyme S subunit
MLDELVKARFVEMFGDPVHNEKGWSTMPLNNVCTTIVDCPHSTPNYTTDDTGFMCIRTSIVKKNKILWDEIEYISEEEFIQRIQRKKPEKGDIIYTREGAILGIAAIINKDCNVALGQRSMLLSPNKNKCTSEFLSVAMNSDSFLENALKGVSGSASPHINVGDIKAFNLIMPPIELQEQFSIFVTQVDKSKVAIQSSLDQTQQLFDSLMQEYFG